MEMSQAERKLRKTIQFLPEELQEIVNLMHLLKEVEGLDLSQPGTVLYAVRKLTKRLNKG